jgi:hypothetical protein
MNRLHAYGSALLVMAALLAADATRARAGEGPLPPADADSEPRGIAAVRWEGEFGLWVQEVDGEVEVSWLTEDAVPGEFEAVAGMREVHRTTTPEGTAHRVSFPTPRAGALSLRYGTAGRMHHTEIRLADRDRRAGFSVSGVDSVFVVGDVHGEYDNLVALLRNVGLVDERLRWTGGRAHLVLLGDLMDRGPDVTPVLWLAYRLEEEARRARGRVHVVLGNHEILVMMDDLRYVAAREEMLAHRHAATYSAMFDPRASVLGRWLATKPAVLRINDVLYAHGGVAEPYTAYSLRSYDETLGALMREELFRSWPDASVAPHLTPEQLAAREEFFWGQESPFWFRGYVFADTLDAELGRVLRHFRSRLHVVAHTPVPEVVARYGGDVVAVNVQEPATELLLLVRGRRGATERFRWRLDGSPVPLPAGSTSFMSGADRPPG